MDNSITYGEGNGYPDFIGNVYFFRSAGLIKIGITQRSVNRRAAGVRSSTKQPVEILGSIRLKDHGNIEMLLHNRFKHLRVHGEWFTPDDELIKFIDRVLSTNPDYDQMIDLIQS